MIELWKEFYGIRQDYSEMKTREDFLVFTDTLMSQTPSCIEGIIPYEGAVAQPDRATVS